MIERHDQLQAGQPIIELRHLSKRFILHKERQRSIQDSFVRLFRPRRSNDRSVFWPLRDISLTVWPGDTLGIIGPNGSGKSTLLKVITGILDPTGGDVAVSGRIASLLELGAGFHPDLTGRENIFLNGAILGINRRQMAGLVDKIIDFAELGDFIDVPVKHYSSGMYVRLGFAVAIHTEPDLLLVDEVLAVGDTAFQHKCMDAIQKFRAGGGTLLLVSHDLGTIQTICKKAIWLDHGEMRASGAPTDVVMAYLNEVAHHEDEAAGRERLDELPEGKRWGTGNVEITSVELCDVNGRPCNIFVDGGTMEIRIQYRTRGRVVDPIFGVAVHTQNGAHICGPNTRFSGCYIPFVEGTGEVRYRIPSLPLLEGAYAVSVAATNGTDTEQYDYHRSRLPFPGLPWLVWGALRPGHAEG